MSDDEKRPILIADISPMYWKDGAKNPNADKELELNFVMVDYEAWCEHVIDEEIEEDPVLRYLQSVLDAMSEFENASYESYGYSFSPEERGMGFAPYQSWLEQQNWLCEKLTELHEANAPLLIDIDGETEEYFVDGEKPSVWYTYNWETALSSDIHGLTFCVEGEQYMIWSEHIGADARGGFAPLRVGRVADNDGYVFGTMGVRYSIHDRRNVPAEGQTDLGISDRRDGDWIDLESSLRLAYEWLEENGIELVFPPKPEGEKYYPRIDANLIETNHPDVDFYVDHEMDS